MNDHLNTIDTLKPLTTEQYDKARETAIERTGKRIGERPTRQQFQRELGAIWNVLDLIALLVFTAALIVSSIHIIVHMGILAQTSFEIVSQANAGVILGKNLYVATHQILSIFLAEGSAILFTVLFGISQGWRRYSYAALAALATVFVLVANWQSGIGILESVMPPAFTLGIGLKLELLIVETITRRNEVNKRFVAALEIWETATQDVTKHPDFTPMFRQEIWQKLVSLPTNRDFREAPAGFKSQAVRREMERDLWAYETAEKSPYPIPNSTNGYKANEDFLALPVHISNNGNGHGTEN